MLCYVSQDIRHQVSMLSKAQTNVKKLTPNFLRGTTMTFSR